jgi:hypothetical protein
MASVWSNTQPPHEIEPELLRGTPRLLRPKTERNSAVGVGFLTVFLLPFLLAGVWLLATALLTTSVLMFGQVVPATVLSHDTSSDEDGTNYSLEYSYSLDGTTYEASDSVSLSEYELWRDGSTINVRVLPLVPSRGSQLQLSSRNPWMKVVLGWGFALFWNCGILSVLVAIYIAPVVRRRLVTHGLPTAGRISDKKTVKGDDSVSYYLHYEFLPIEYSMSGPKREATFTETPRPSFAPMWWGKMGVTQNEYENAQIGDPVTILFDPRKSKNSLIYKFSGYEVVA